MKKIIDFKKEIAPVEYRRLADLPNRVVQGDPQHQSTTFFKNELGDVIAGVWTSTPGKWHAFSDRDEFCFITAGHVELIADDGTAQAFKAGDSFLIPNGFRGYWHVLETTTKNFVIRSYPPESAGEAPDLK